MLAAGGLVTVFGGSGFVGRHTVRLLARAGFRVRVAVRRPDLAGHLQPMGAVSQIMPVQANLRDARSVAQAIAGADGVVNLVAVLAESGRQRFDVLHVQGAKAVAAAARMAGVHSLVHLSAIGAGASSPSRYGRSKAAGEAAVLAEFPTAVILRPSVIFGPEDDLFNRFAGMAQSMPLLPMIAGTSKFQPVYVGDVAAAIKAALEGIAQPGTVYELGGPEILTMQDMLLQTMAYAGQPRRLLAVPMWAAKLAAVLSKPLPMAMRPVTVDQLRMLRGDTIVSPQAIADARTLGGLGIVPQAIDAIVPGYLERFNPKGQYAHYRG